MKKMTKLVMVFFAVILVAVISIGCGLGTPKFSKIYKQGEYKPYGITKAEVITLTSNGTTDGDGTFKQGSDIISYYQTNKIDGLPDEQVKTFFDVTTKKVVPNISHVANKNVTTLTFNDETFFFVQRKFMSGEDTFFKSALFNRAGEEILAFSESNNISSFQDVGTVIGSTSIAKFFYLNGSIYKIDGSSVKLILADATPNNFRVQLNSLLVEIRSNNNFSSYNIYNFSGTLIASVTCGAGQLLTMVSDKKGLITTKSIMPLDSNDFTYIDEDANKVKIVYQLIQYKNMKINDVKLDYVLSEFDYPAQYSALDCYAKKDFIVASANAINKDKTLNRITDLVYLDSKSLKVEGVLTNAISVVPMSGGNYFKSTADGDSVIIDKKGKYLKIFSSNAGYAQYDLRDKVIGLQGNQNTSIYDVNGALIVNGNDYQYVSSLTSNGYWQATKIVNDKTVYGMIDKDGVFTSNLIDSDTITYQKINNSIYRKIENGKKAVYAFGVSKPLYQEDENMNEELYSKYINTAEDKNNFYCVTRNTDNVVKLYIMSADSNAQSR